MLAMITELHLAQPAWLASFIAARPLPADDSARLAEVLALAGETIGRASGGPFAAVVYDEATGARLGCAVNTVEASCCALAHAETIALALAQQAVAHWTLAGQRCVLVSSAEPCAMCLGAIVWSGVARLVYAATRTDVEAIGFDEGPRPAAWRRALGERGITVSGPRRRATARAVLAAYSAAGGVIYNG